MTETIHCWSCEAAVPAEAESCPACGRLQPPRARDYFAYLGIPRGYHLDLEAIGDVLREKSRRFHPDRFARAEPRERTCSLQHTTLLNDAVRTLRDPRRRAEYILSLHGLRAGAGDRERTRMDPAFLAEVMELRESLAEAKAGADPAALASIGARAKAGRDALLARADARFTAWEASPADRGPLEEIAGLLDRIRYLEQIVADAAGAPIHP